MQQIELLKELQNLSRKKEFQEGLLKGLNLALTIVVEEPCPTLIILKEIRHKQKLLAETEIEILQKYSQKKGGF